MSRTELATESTQALDRLAFTLASLRRVVGILAEGPDPMLCGHHDKLVDEAKQMLTVLLCNGALLELDEPALKEFYVTLDVGGKEIVLTKRAACLADASAVGLAYAALTFPGRPIELKRVLEAGAF